MNERIVNIYEAKTTLSQLIKAVTEVEQVVIATAGKSLLRLVSYEAPPPPRRFVLVEGEVKLTPDFDDPLSEEVLMSFEGAE